MSVPTALPSLSAALYSVVLPLVPLVPSLELGPGGSLSGGIALELVWNKAGQRLGIFPAPESRQLPLLWGGSGNLPISLFYQLPAELLVGGGPWGGSLGLGRSLCLPLPFSWSSWAPNPRSEKACTLPTCFIYHSELWGLLLDLVLRASPERGVLEAGGTQSPHNLFAQQGEEAAHGLPPPGWAGERGGAFSALQSPRRRVGRWWAGESRRDWSPVHHQGAPLSSALGAQLCTGGAGRGG